VEAAAAEASAAARGVANAAADAPGARAALAPELPKEPGGGADGMAEDAEEIPGRPVFSVGGRVRVFARSVVRGRGVVFTTPVVFFTHHRLVTRPVVRTIMDAGQAFIDEKLATLFEIGLAAAPQLETIKQRVFSGLRAKGFAEATVGAQSGLLRVMGKEPPQIQSCAWAPSRPGRRRLTGGSWCLV
jgi:hypothetical protein